MEWNTTMLEFISPLLSTAFSKDEMERFLWQKKCYYLLYQYGHSKKMQAQIGAQLKRNHYYQFLMLKECEPIFSQLSVGEYAMVKGAAASQAIYGTPYFRHSNDVDIVISSNASSKVKSILEKMDLFKEGILMVK